MRLSRENPVSKRAFQMGQLVPLRLGAEQGSRNTLVGRCTLNAVDPKLESDWFQTLTLEHQSWFQNVPFKFNLYRYSPVCEEKMEFEPSTGMCL